MLDAHDVSFGYDDTLVLRGVTISAGTSGGSVLGLIGPNGSGKTTLLRILYTALQPRHGAVLVDDTPVTALPGRELAQRIAVVAQEALPELPLTVTEMVMLGRSPHRSAFQPYTRSDRRVAASALHRVGMRGHADRGFGTLSGGEKQRVLIARALAQQTRHLLLDEPTNHLDIHYQHDILRLIRELGTTTVVVLHDLNLAARYCDHIVLLDRGEAVAAGTTTEVLTASTLESVYHVTVRVLHDDDCVQLVFRPYPGE